MAHVKIYWSEYTEKALTPAAVQSLNQDLAKKFHLNIGEKNATKKISFFSKLMLHEILSTHYSLKNPLQNFRKNKEGKPSIGRQNLHFNISHSNNLVCVAICTEAPIGVDVQHIRKFSEMLIPRVLTPEEKQEYSKCSDKQQFFFSTWSKKEACVKATGIGIKIGLKNFSVNEKTAIVQHSTLYLMPLKLKESYSAAVAVKCPISKITVIKQHF